ncbi:hypothetical protein L6452_16849 [Arctium lappa]|uniref:Uncharacterized protein n=1 Tax=Arctium lappa TaxID=4217 RepID=A0ACB9C239_ARCLA|nr:hypothetical protein L6452_16849 [Arctium lappa]
MPSANRQPDLCSDSRTRNLQIARLTIAVNMVLKLGKDPVVIVESRTGERSKYRDVHDFAVTKSCGKSRKTLWSRFLVIPSRRFEVFRSIDYVP